MAWRRPGDKPLLYDIVSSLLVLKHKGKKCLVLVEHLAWVGGSSGPQGLTFSDIKNWTASLKTTTIHQSKLLLLPTHN